MQPNQGIIEQVTKICKMGKEPTEAVGRILMRIDQIEAQGEGKFQYFCSIEEITPIASFDKDNLYELRPDRCMCTAWIKILMMTGTRCEIWLDRIFIIEDDISTQGLAETGG